MVRTYYFNSMELALVFAFYYGYEEKKWTSVKKQKRKISVTVKDEHFWLEKPIGIPYIYKFESWL